MDEDRSNLVVVHLFEPITLLLSDLVLLQLKVCDEEGCVLLADGYV